MANPEHLEILQQGVEQWNEWREEHEDILPDLSEALLGGKKLSKANFVGTDLRYSNLTGADLKFANLRDAILNGSNIAMADLRAADLRLADLRRAILAGSNLGEANLSSANLNSANLRGTSLRGANLSEANIRGAYLNEANLCGADLNRANLRASYLWGANLSGADLTVANLREAVLTGADLSDALTWRTQFDDLDLSVAQGLETVKHQGPSTIGIDTMYKSRGKIPEVFLRGCGLQDWEIELVKLYQADLGTSELTTILYRVSELRSRKPIRYSSCFISYSTKDQEFADRLYADLQNKGVRCWFAPHDMHGGRKLHEQIDDAIRLHDKLLLILSEHSMNSDWVGTEIANAREREVREKKQMLFPIALAPFDDVKKWKLFDADRGKDSAREIREYFIPDFSNWKDHDSYQKAFQRLVNDLKAEVTGAAG